MQNTPVEENLEGWKSGVLGKIGSVIYRNISSGDTCTDFKILRSFLVFF